MHDPTSRGLKRPWSPSVRLRKAHVGDVPALARVYVDTWRAAYEHILPPAYLARLSYKGQATGWQRTLCTPGTATWIAETQRRQLVGFASGGATRGETSIYFSEINTLYLLPSFQRQGIGRRLVAAFSEQVMSIGLRSMLIWVLRDNPCRGFYSALGGEEVGERPVNVGGEKFIEVAYGWRDVRRILDSVKSER